MARFEIDVKMIVEADDSEEAFSMAESAVQNMVCGEIVEAWVDGVTDLGMAE